MIEKWIIDSINDNSWKKWCIMSFIDLTILEKKYVIISQKKKKSFLFKNLFFEFLRCKIIN